MPGAILGLGRVREREEATFFEFSPSHLAGNARPAVDRIGQEILLKG